MSKILFAVLAFACTTAVASDWQPAGKSDSATYVMDFESVATVQKYKKAWVRGDFLNDTEIADTFPKKKYRSVKALYYFDCTAKMSAGVQVVYYAESGEVVQSDTYKFDPKLLTDVVPDTVGEQFLSVACSTPAARAKMKARNVAAMAGNGAD